jgi:hypothetical protein
MTCEQIVEEFALTKDLETVVDSPGWQAIDFFHSMTLSDAPQHVAIDRSW